jgi:predicted RNase H-like nuclease
MTKYIGIDGCKKGWFYFSLDDDRSYDFGILKTIREVSIISNKGDIILIDIPIGLREKDKLERTCDKEARKLLKRKGSSVFPAPSRLSLNAKDYQTASNLNYKYTGRKLSKQSYSIIPKIKDVDDFVRTIGQSYRIREFHPELCFLALNDFIPLKYSKNKKEGQIEREKILSKYFKSVSEIISQASKHFLRRQVAIDDIVDAIVGALTAIFKDRTITTPLYPEIDNKNLKMEILYPGKENLI